MRWPLRPVVRPVQPGPVAGLLLVLALAGCFGEALNLPLPGGRGGEGIEMSMLDDPGTAEAWGAQRATPADPVAADGVEGDAPAGAHDADDDAGTAGAVAATPTAAPASAVNAGGTAPQARPSHRPDPETPTAQTPAAQDPPPASDATASPRPEPPGAAACRARGGRFQPVGGGAAFVCVLPAPDAGRPCASGRDCAGLCLARSRSCAPFIPLMGCHDILTDSGVTARQCVE